MDNEIKIGESGTLTPNDGSLNINLGKNINAKKVKDSSNKETLVISTAQKVEFKQVTIGDVDKDGKGTITISNNALTIKDGVKVDINMGGNQIHNIAAGVAPTDAVNVSQLNEVKDEVTNIANKVGNVEKRANEGISSAMAAAGLPQAYLPGHSMVSAAGSTYKGATGLAVGISTISDNGKWIIKGSVNSNSSGGVGATLGAGYQW
ncbi:YadA family autotransporter adhesin [Phocoenobacter atlanticus]|nr:YadA-like family protein [Pasteurella atlantica]MDP8166783.1 YadA-like family protein [Pasteurella atlantica]